MCVVKVKCGIIKTIQINLDKKVKDYLEYPVCMSSIYKRGFKPPKGVTVRCSKYQ